MSSQKTTSKSPKDMQWAIVGNDFDEFIQEYTKSSQQEALFKARVNLTTAKDPGVVKERVLLVSTFRLITIKKVMLSRKSVRQSIPINTLQGLAILTSKGDKNKIIIRITFPDETIDVEAQTRSPMASSLVQSILGVWKAVSYGFPVGMEPMISIPKEYLTEFEEPQPDVCDGILSTYLASCDKAGVSPQLQIVEYFMSSFLSDTRMFDLGDCIGYKEVNKRNVYNKTSPGQLLQIASALRYTDFFNEFVSIGYPINEEAIGAFADMYKRPIVTKAVFVNAGLKSGGAAALSRVIALGQHNLKFLNLSRNPLGDTGLQTLVEALDRGKRVVSSLCFQSCGITAHGIGILMDMLCKPLWMKGMQALDVSENRLRKTGSAHLARFLKNCQLEKLFAKNCDLDTEKIFIAVLENGLGKLQTLDISGNKVDRLSKEELLHKILRTSRTLHTVSLRKITMHKTLLPGVMTAVFENKHQLNLVLDISECGIGENGSKALLNVFQKLKSKGGKPFKTNISSLNLNDNGLGAKGIKNVVDALVDTDIRTLSLDRNYKPGFFSSGKEVGEALEKCIKHWPQLRNFSFDGGDSSQLGKLAYPFLEALAQNTTLTQLSIADNRIGDVGIEILSESLKKNKTITSIDVDRNKITMTGLIYLEDMCVVNKSLTDWVVPMDDITRICKNYPEKAEDLKEILNEFENSMDRNAEELTKEADEKKGDFQVLANENWGEQVVTRKRKDTRIIGGLKSTLRLKKIIAGQTLDAKKFTTEGKIDSPESKEDEAVREVFNKLAKAESNKASKSRALPEGWGLDPEDD